MVAIYGLCQSARERIDNFIDQIEPIGVGDVNVTLYENVEVKYSFGNVMLSDSSEIQTISQYDFDRIEIF